MTTGIIGKERHVGHDKYTLIVHVFACILRDRKSKKERKKKGEKKRKREKEIERKAEKAREK